MASGLNVPGRESISFYQWIGEVLEQGDAETAAKVIMLYWSIWTARNEIVWNQRWRSVNEVVAFAMLTLD